MRQLVPIVKTYDWGMKAKDSLACLFTNCLNNYDRISELWWGHPYTIVKETNEKVETSFLLKLLFVEKPLSLQAHPTQGQVATFSFHDALAKPEVIIALTDFEALCGFLTEEQLVERVSPIPILSNYHHFQSLFQVRDIDPIILSVQDYARRHSSIPHCRIFLSLLELYPSGDPCVLCPFYMNIIHLKKGQALFIPASQPHCYLSGQGVECMPPSDNIVRCGLTKKTCDRDLFFDICSTSPKEIIIMDNVYNHPELNKYFKIVLFHPNHNSFFSCRQGSLALVLNGEGTINGKETHTGDSWLMDKNELLAFSKNMTVLVVVPSSNLIDR